MIQNIKLIVFLSWSVCCTINAQTTLKKYLDQQDFRGLENYASPKLKAHKPLDLNLLAEYLHLQSDSVKIALLDSINSAIIITSLGASLLDKKLSQKTHKDELLDFYRHWALKHDKFTFWADLTLQLAHNQYYGGDILKVGFYYDQLMHNWEKFDKHQQFLASFMSGNHFMGVEQNFDKALVYYQKIETIAGLENDKIEQYNLMMAELFYRKKDYSRAEEYANINLLRNDSSSSKQIQNLILVGKINFALYNIDKAKQLLEQADKLLLKEDNKFRNWSKTLNLYCQIQSLLLNISILKKNKMAAVKYATNLINEPQKIQKTLDGQTSLIIYKTLLRYYFYVNNKDAFIKQFNLINPSFLTIPISAPLYSLLGDMWQKEGALEKALQAYNKTLSLLKNKTTTNLKYLYSQDPPEALNTLSKKLDVLQALKRNNSKKLESINDQIYATAIEAIQLIDQIRQGLVTKKAKLDLLKITPNVYEYALEILSARYLKHKDDKYLFEIFSLIEDSKAILLSDAIQEQSAKKFGKVPSKLIHQEKVLVSDLKFHESKLDNAMREKDSLNIDRFRMRLFNKRNTFEQLKKNLEYNYPKYFSYKYKNRQTDISRVQEYLANHSAKFISYFWGNRSLYICSLNEKDIELRMVNLINNTVVNIPQTLPKLRQLLSDLKEVLSLNESKLKLLYQFCHQFYQLLLQDELQSNDFKRLVISPDGPLHYIPFEILLNKKQAKPIPSIKKWPFLIQKYPISYNYNANLWISCLEMNPSISSKGILAMAASYDENSKKEKKSTWLDRQSLSPLLGAKKEVEWLKAQYQGSYYIGLSASEKAFRAQSASHHIIHLAMHGLIYDKQPMNSCLVFSQNNDSLYDDALHSYELTNLDLNTSLLVLSACSTADGQYYSGEGVMSMARGFMYAGASSVLSSLWPINDNSSQQIMQSFYQYLYQGNDKDVALQQAKLDFIRDNNGAITHPLFWSAFVLMGDSNPVDIKHNHPFMKGWLIILFLGLGGLIFIAKYRSSKEVV